MYRNYKTSFIYKRQDDGIVMIQPSALGQSLKAKAKAKLLLRRCIVFMGSQLKLLGTAVIHDKKIMKNFSFKYWP
jgi:hypothetical protein